MKGLSVTKTQVPPTRSLYRKIEIVLSEARKGVARSKDDLIDIIRASDHMDFYFYKTDEEGHTSTIECSRECVGNVISLCINLKLLEIDTMRPTPAGRKATDPERFAEIIGQRIKERLKELGMSIDAIHDTILKILKQGEGKVLPTADSVFATLGIGKTKKEEDEFRTYLGLLSACGAIKYSRKKLYLP